MKRAQRTHAPKPEQEGVQLNALQAALMVCVERLGYGGAAVETNTGARGLVGGTAETWLDFATGADEMVLTKMLSDAANAVYQRHIAAAMRANPLAQLVLPGRR